MLSTLDPERVSALIRRTAEAVILPRFRTLSPEQIREKKPGDLVTVADTEAEAMLGSLLTGLVPGSVVCGEEGVACDRAILERLDGERPVWLIDPVDGTGNFAAGRPAFAVIVALIEGRAARAGWVHDPLGNVTVLAMEGLGAWCQGQRLVARDRPLGGMTGTADGRLPGGGSAAGRLAARGTVGAIVNSGSGGIDYLRLARGETQFKLSSASLPWDHAAGLLIMAEAGAATGFLDGSAFDLHHHNRQILVAPSRDSWTALQRVLLEPEVIGETGRTS